jgi:hypothetical protein
MLKLIKARVGISLLAFARGPDEVATADSDWNIGDLNQSNVLFDLTIIRFKEDLKDP